MLLETVGTGPDYGAQRRTFTSPILATFRGAFRYAFPPPRFFQQLRDPVGFSYSRSYSQQKAL